MTDAERSTPLSGTIVRGVIAGIVAATAMALWFLVIDASQATPFRTPAFLANELLGTNGIQPTVGSIFLYTLVHYAAWIIVGLLISWMLRTVHTAPTVLLGIVVGFLLFDIVFYTSVAVTGVDVINALGWPEVLAGNLLAGVSLMGFLHLTGATPPVTWWSALVEGNLIVRDGIVSGLIGAVVVAAWFLLFDAFRGSPFLTPGALGSALFLGARDMSAVQVDVATVLGYSILHVAAFCVAGFIAAAFVVEAERHPPLILGAVLLFVAFEAFFMGFLAMVAEFLLGPLAWWTIAVGNALATLSMGYYLWARHPQLQKVLRSNPLDQTV